MRLVRALAHLVLALALVTASVAQPRAMGAMAAPPPHHGSAHDHQTAAVGAAHGEHGASAHGASAHGAPAAEHPVHKRDGCQTACCFVAAQPPARAPEASVAAFFRTVRYVLAAEPASGQADAPEPGIPKPAA